VETTTGSGYSVITSIITVGSDPAPFYAATYAFHNRLGNTHGDVSMLQAIVNDLNHVETPPAPEKPQSLGKFKVTASALRVRQTPSTSGSVMGYVMSGEIVDVYGYYPDDIKQWACITTDSNRWVGASYLVAS
jgi:hypothetical protein